MFPDPVRFYLVSIAGSVNITLDKDCSSWRLCVEALLRRREHPPAVLVTWVTVTLQIPKAFIFL